MGQGREGECRKAPAQMRLTKEIKLFSLKWQNSVLLCCREANEASSPTNAVWKWHGINASLESRSYSSDRN